GPGGATRRARCSPTPGRGRWSRSTPRWPRRSSTGCSSCESAAEPLEQRIGTGRVEEAVDLPRTQHLQRKLSPPRARRGRPPPLHPHGPPPVAGEPPGPPPPPCRGKTERGTGHD